MAKRHAKKRRLTEEEIKQVRQWMETSPQNRKPTIRQIARAFGVNQPSVVKSLGGWKGIKRNKPQVKKGFKLETGQSPVKIEPFTTDLRSEVYGGGG